MSVRITSQSNGVDHGIRIDSVRIVIKRKARILSSIRHCVLHIGFAQHLVGFFRSSSRGGRAELIVTRLICLVIRHADCLAEIVEAVGVFLSR